LATWFPFCCVGVARCALEAADVITSRCLTPGRNRPTWQCCSKIRHSWRHGISRPGNNVIHCLERVETVKTEILFVDIYI
jgi:hypothetical protein